MECSYGQRVGILFVGVLDNLPSIICHVFTIVVIFKSLFDICLPFGLHAASFPYNACATCFALGLLTCLCKGLTRGLGVCLMSHVGVILSHN